MPSFTVEKITEAKANLQEKGCRILIEREKSLYFSDPRDNVWDNMKVKL